MTIEELFGTLQQAVVASWRKHLRAAKYSKHEALNDFYEEMPELVDKLIEDWMGVNGKKIKEYTNIIKSKNMNTLNYLKELRRIAKQGYALMQGEKELEADLDSIIDLIDTTMYKVKELNENRHMGLKEFLNESLMINESDPRGDYKVKKNWTADEIFWEFTDPNQRAEFDEETLQTYDRYCQKAKEAGWKTKKVDNVEYYVIPRGTKLEFIGHNPHASHMGQFAINGDEDWIIEIMYDSLKYGDFDDYLKEI